jgi:putative heme-binding domain-containing protein
MPHFASSEVDDEGLRLVSDWIAAMRTHGRSAGLRPGENEQPTTTSEALALALHTSRLGVEARIRAATRIHSQAGVPAATRDLFERFLPDNPRVEKLGTGFKPETILSLKGDAKRGEQIFFAEGGAQCANCHRVNGRGKDVGPDLSAVGKKLDRAKLLESLVEPSKTIEPQFAAYTVLLKDGDSQSGLLVSRDAAGVVLKDLTGQLLRFTTAQVRKVQPQELSLMPEALLAGLTAQEAADLVEYLATLQIPNPSR